MPTKSKTTLHQRGNPIANHPLMRKGGIHRKSRSSKRQKQRRETHQLVEKHMGMARAKRGRGGGRDFAKKPSKGKKA